MIQKSDAIVIKSILEIVDVYGIINQYDLSIDIYDSILDGGIDNFTTQLKVSRCLSSQYCHKNTTENLSDQANAKTKLNSAFTSIENILQTLWYRGLT